MARKKITPEEETPKTVAPEESAAADVGDMTQNDLPPSESGTAEGRGAEAVPAMEATKDADGTSVGGDPPKEGREEDLAETASAEMPAADIPAEEEAEPAPMEEQPMEEETGPEPADAIAAAVESVLAARSKDTAGPETERDADGVDITPGKLPEIYEAHEAALEPPEYSIDLSEEPEPVPARDAASPDAEEDDWGFREPRREVTGEEAPAQPASIVLPVRPAPSVPSVPSVLPKAAVKSDRQLFFELKFNELDRGLTPEERQEWNSIYASYRGRSALAGTIIGVDPRSIYVWNPRTEKKEKLTMYCAIVVPYRVRIMIPETEMWEEGEERPDYVLQNMVGAKIDFIIIKVEREAGFAVGSHRLASRSQRYFFAHREDLHSIGARVKCQLMAVGPRRCLAECYGHDIDLTQREISYTAIPDLRNKYHAGVELDCIVKVYDPEKDELVISIKEIETNPFLGAELRHPVGCRRLAVISGKYGGGVFCNLPDGVVCMCNYSYQHEDSDFMVGENVMLVVQRYDDEKLQVFGKIMSKW